MAAAGLLRYTSRRAWRSDADVPSIMTGNGRFFQSFFFKNSPSDCNCNAVLRWCQPAAEGCQGSRRGRSSTERRRDSENFGGARGSIGRRCPDEADRQRNSGRTLKISAAPGVGSGAGAGGGRAARSEPAAEGCQGSRSSKHASALLAAACARGSIGSGGRRRPCCEVPARRRGVPGVPTRPIVNGTAAGLCNFRRRPG